jgi:hypothetical protein
MATSKNTKTKATTTATDSPIDDLFGALDSLGDIGTIARKASAPTGDGTGHRGRARDCVANPLDAGENVRWGQGAQGRKLQTSKVLNDRPELVNVLHLNAADVVATATANGSFAPYTVTLTEEDIVTVIDGMRACYNDVVEGRGKFASVAEGALDSFAMYAAYDDDITDPRNVSYGWQSVARHALSVFGVDNFVVEGRSATFTVAPMVALMKGTGDVKPDGKKSNMSKLLQNVFAALGTAEGRTTFKSIILAATDEERSRLAVTSASYFAEAVKAATEERAGSVRSLGEAIVGVTVGSITDEDKRNTAADVVANIA